MPPSQLLWHLRNDSGHHALCYLSPQTDDGYLLLITRAWSVIVAEEHGAPDPALERAAGVCAQLIEEGWHLVADTPSVPQGT